MCGDLNQIGSVKGYATRQAVIEVAKSFNPVASPITKFGRSVCGMDR